MLFSLLKISKISFFLIYKFIDKFFFSKQIKTENKFFIIHSSTHFANRSSVSSSNRFGDKRSYKWIRLFEYFNCSTSANVSGNFFPFVSGNIMLTIPAINVMIPITKNGNESPNKCYIEKKEEGKSFE